MNKNLPLLVDLDGVLRSGKNPCKGVTEFLDFINNNNIDAVILSNTTQSSAEELYGYFKEFNINVDVPIITAADASLNYVKSRYKSAAVYAMPKVKRMFDGLLNYTDPEVIVMGDLGREWNYNILNEIFKLAYKGIPIVAMQKNKFWKTPEDGLLLDLGAFVKSIEFAADAQAVLIGKPSELYFMEGLKMINRQPDEKFFMIGDDYTNDILPVLKMGGEACLIYTGKTEYPLSEHFNPRPDHEAMDLYEVIKILEDYL